MPCRATQHTSRRGEIEREREREGERERAAAGAGIREARC